MGKFSSAVCKRGHLLIGDNRLVRKPKEAKQYVTCRTCHNERSLRYWREHHSKGSTKRDS